MQSPWQGPCSINGAQKITWNEMTNTWQEVKPIVYIHVQISMVWNSSWLHWQGVCSLVGVGGGLQDKGGQSTRQHPAVVAVQPGSGVVLPLKRTCNQYCAKGLCYIIAWQALGLVYETYTWFQNVITFSIQFFKKKHLYCKKVFYV